MTEVKHTAFELENRAGDAIRGDVRVTAEARSGAAIVVCHGFKGFKDWGFFPHLAEQLAGRTRYPVVSFNFSGSGIGPDLQSFSEPERFATNTFTRELEDLGAVLDAVQAGVLPALGPTDRVGLLGHSRGGGIAILRAAEDSRVACLVTWATIGTVDRWSDEEKREWRRTGELPIQNVRTGEVLPLGTDVLEDIESNADRLDIVSSASRLRVPFLLLHGTADESVSATESRLIAQAAPTSETQMIAGAGHTFGAVHPFRGPTDPLRRAVELSAEWFSRHLRD